ncbi:hypothetical protein NL676_013691 [Syzygium grande]|nr:hypothetical protein NL676_013691 [Syzygium grande]
MNNRLMHDRGRRLATNEIVISGPDQRSAESAIAEPMKRIKERRIKREARVQVEACAAGAGRRERRVSTAWIGNGF